MGKVGRPHGVRGELRLRPFNRESDLLLGLDEVLVRFPDGEEQEVSIDGARKTPDAILLKLHAVNDRRGAEELCGAVVCARRGDFPPLEPGEFYTCDLEGACVVLDSGDGVEHSLGRVRVIRTYPSAEVIVVDCADGSSFEVPLVDSVIRRVDLEGGRVTICTMDGVERE
ncbi:MAG: ribosome maturation factor RimM [Polyangiaceae bacterium]